MEIVFTKKAALSKAGVTTNGNSQKNNSLVLGAMNIAPLVDPCFSPVMSNVTDVATEFCVIKRNGYFFVERNNSVAAKEFFDIQIQVENVMACFEDVISEDNFNDDIVDGTFEEKINVAALKDAQAAVIKKLKDESKRTQELCLEAVGLNNKKLVALYKRQILDLDYAINQLKMCGTLSVPGKDVVIKDHGNSRSFTGLKYCKSNFCCYCSALKLNRRALLIKEKLTAAMDGGCRAFLITLNLKHYYSLNNFQLLQEILFKNLDDLIESNFVKSVKKGFSKNYEITYNAKNGLNQHFHLLLLVDQTVDENKLREKIKNKWEINLKEKYDRTCDLSVQPGWFLPVNNTKQDIARVSNYFRSGVSNKSGFGIQDEVTSRGKAPIWEQLPPAIYAKVFKESKDRKFFSSGGLLRVKSSEQPKEVKEATITNKLKEPVELLRIPRQIYLKIDIGTRILIRSIVKDKSLNNTTCINRVKSILSKYLERFTSPLFDQDSS